MDNNRQSTPTGQPAAGQASPAQNTQTMPQPVPAAPTFAVPAPAPMPAPVPQPVAPQIPVSPQVAPSQPQPVQAPVLDLPTMPPTMPIPAPAPVAAPAMNPLQTSMPEQQAPVPQPQPVVPQPTLISQPATPQKAEQEGKEGKASWAPRSIFDQFKNSAKSQDTKKNIATNPFYSGNAPAKNKLVQDLDAELESAKVNEDAKWQMQQQPAPAPQPVVNTTQQIMPTPTQARPTNEQIVSSQQDTGFAPAQIAAPRKTIKRTKVSTTQNSLQIAEVRDNMLIMKDGSFRAVIACKAINFDLMNSEEREAIEYSYQNFLNSLNFDVQILVRSQKIDIAPYLDKLVNLRRNEENMLLGVLMDDYIAFIDALSREANIMSKSFFVVVNYYPIDTNVNVKDQGKNFFKRLFSINNQSVFKIDQRTYNEGMSKISDRCDAVLSGLYQTGIQCTRLKTKELAALFYDFYNPDISIREPLGNFADTTTLYTGKGK
ncbi:hypothetical protein FWH09_00330 [Candidatus Saccharibacteria bacterium]|nr:hypothetical protein [Candidatus Saccharibacteria bacterium]